MSDRDHLLKVLQRAVNLGASDVHLHSGAPVAFRINGVLTIRGSAELPAEVATNMAMSLLRDDQRKEFEENGQIEIVVGLPGLARLRTCMCRQLRGIDMVMRVIRAEPLGLPELGMQVIADATQYRDGLVVITGPAGSGKSSTLAALVEKVNQTRKGTLIFLEDPIEQIHNSKASVVSQRHIGKHSRSYAIALRAALRQDPDVIVIGEVRDWETASLSLLAAETGHLVLSTMHTGGAIATIDRIVSMFPPDEQPRARMMLSNSLRAIVSQRLVSVHDGSGRVPAVEILRTTPAIGQLIRENALHQLTSAMQLGVKQGMCTLEDSLRKLVRAGKVSQQEAYKHGLTGG
jgi:twitching motility protein PilT